MKNRVLTKVGAKGRIYALDPIDEQKILKTRKEFAVYIEGRLHLTNDPERTIRRNANRVQLREGLYKTTDEVDTFLIEDLITTDNDY